MPMTIIPTPPNHWSMARQSLRLRGRASRWVMMVDPVVVIPRGGFKDSVYRA